MCSGCWSQSGLPRQSQCIVPPGRPVAVEVGEGALGVAVLEGVEPALLAPLEQLHDPLGRVPVGHVAVEVLVEVRVAVDRVAADDQPGDAMRPEGDRGQQGGRRGGSARRLRRGGRRGDPGGHTGGLVQEAAPTRGGSLELRQVDSSALSSWQTPSEMASRDPGSARLPPSGLVPGVRRREPGRHLARQEPRTPVFVQRHLDWHGEGAARRIPDRRGKGPAARPGELIRRTSAFPGGRRTSRRTAPGPCPGRASRARHLA